MGWDGMGWDILINLLPGIDGTLPACVVGFSLCGVACFCLDANVLSLVDGGVHFNPFFRRCRTTSPRTSCGESSPTS